MSTTSPSTRRSPPNIQSLLAYPLIHTLPPIQPTSYTPYTPPHTPHTQILRPGRLTDGPYTSYDLNTLLQATSGTRQAVTVSPKDTLDGETSRIAVAEAAVQCLVLPGTVNKAYSLTSLEGEGPGTNTDKWKALLV